MFGVTKPKVNNNPTYRLIIDTVRRKNKISIRDLSRILYLRLEVVEMYVYKGINESYLTKIGEDHKAYIMAKYKN